MSKKELIVQYEHNREALIAAHRRKFLELETSLTTALSALQDDLVKTLEEDEHVCVKPVEQPAEPVEEPVEEPVVKMIKKVAEVAPKVAAKRGSNNSWNMKRA